MLFTDMWKSCKPQATLALSLSKGAASLKLQAKENNEELASIGFAFFNTRGTRGH